MIPLKLRLRNFMCYRENASPLDFKGIHVACLAGDNGHGKSALLDAMTWALWGKSRARNDDSLIYLNANEMEVEFEFALEDNRYRVIRKRRRGKGRRSGQTVLELQVGRRTVQIHQRAHSARHRAAHPGVTTPGL
ncbi:MAG: AAA family ATPase [Anaerolineae bacterium]|nr:AAA family ATPase [Anaerolineae bacterium]